MRIINSSIFLFIGGIFIEFIDNLEQWSEWIFKLIDFLFQL